MKDIPFFYYDIVARIFPGGVVISLLVFTIPELHRFISGPEPWKTATIPLAFIGLSYMIGVLFEVLFTDWLVWQWVGDMTFRAAVGEDAWPNNVTSSTMANRADCRALRDKAWFDLVLAGEKDRAQGFPHALRFWAEAKMCMHTFLPVFCWSYHSFF